MSIGVEAQPAVPIVRRLVRRAFTLGAANAFDYAMQFLLPVVLARCLDAAAFGQYRLLWLAVGTVMAFAPAVMQGSLYYFLPRSDGATKRLYINQTLLFLAFAGVIAAWAVSAWNPWLPEKMRGLTQPEVVVPAFVLLWVVASLLDLLPTVEERVAWQTRVTIGLSTLRAIALSLAAALTGELTPVLFTLLAFVVFKVAVLLHYVAKHHGLRGPILRWSAFAGQVRLVAPFWVSNTLYGLRAQADQWIAAALFSLGMFAAFSIAAVLGPLVTLIRQSVNHAFLPSMSRLDAAGDLPSVIELNSRANLMVAALVYPLLAFVFVFAEEVVTIVYTGTYVDAASVMRVYIVGLAAQVIEHTSIMVLLRQGAFAIAANAAALTLAIALSWFSAHHIGLAGAAVGSVTAFYLELSVSLRRIARRSGIPVRRLQQWRALGMLMLFSALAAAFAWGVVDRYFATGGLMVRVAVGGAVLAAAYGALTVLSSIGRGWLAAARNPERGV
jgi:O-antigen/teichoic acid export membrane protein